MISPTSPVVNGNGTDRRELAEGRMDAIRALHGAEAALVAVTVNGRDYIGDPVRFAAAIAAHEARIKAVQTAIRDLTNEVIDLRK